MINYSPIEENADKGFHYTVTEKQIGEHKRRSLSEIFSWLENTSKFIYNLQTEEERIRIRRGI
jgi:hypothetical protein